MSTSALQRYVSDELSAYLGRYTIRENIRPDWLTDDTGERLELDFYIEELNIAIEVQGQQHYNYVPYFHGDMARFELQQARDKIKHATCQARGITLLEVFDQIGADMVIQSVVSKTERQVVEPQLPLEKDIHPTGMKLIKATSILASHIRLLQLNPKDKHAADVANNRYRYIADALAVGGDLTWSRVPEQFREWILSVLPVAEEVLNVKQKHRKYAK